MVLPAAACKRAEVEGIRPSDSECLRASLRRSCNQTWGQSRQSTSPAVITLNSRFLGAYVGHALFVNRPLALRPNVGNLGGFPEPEIASR